MIGPASMVATLAGSSVAAAEGWSTPQGLSSFLLALVGIGGLLWSIWSGREQRRERREREDRKVPIDVAIEIAKAA